MTVRLNAGKSPFKSFQGKILSDDGGGQSYDQENIKLVQF